jgi:Tol biopolymer transport system component
MDPERVRAQLDRILASAEFSGAERASSFLRFVVLRALSGRAGEIKESVIAVEALGRSASFDSKSDSIVRVEAKRLRDRLDLFYRNEGAGDPILISLPTGGYVPEFSERPPTAVTPRRMRSVMAQAGWALFALAAAALGWLYFHKAAESPIPFRLSILPPENTSFEGFAISPDGRTIAFTAVWKGRTALWVRSFNSLEAKPLTGTDYASQPFWSPDNRSIGFFTNSKLKTIGVSGGPTRDLADVVVGRGASWSREGVIVFGAKPTGALYQVSANGGVPRAVTSLDTSRAETSHALPHFLPDGRHFLYLAASPRSGASTICVGSLDGETSKTLLAGDAGAAYVQGSKSRAASLLFVHGGVLMAQPFDVRSLSLLGEKSVVAHQARYRRWREPGFSVSANGLLLYQPGLAESRRFTWFNRQGKLLETIGAPNDFAAFNLSPDGRYVALWSDNDPATPLPTVWLMDLSREAAVSRFSELSAAEAAFLPVWSPDSRVLLFSLGDERRMRLVRKSLNGGPVQPVLDSDGPKFPSDWSSDGQFVAFSSQWPDYRDMHIWLVQLGAGSPPRAFAQHPYPEMEGHFAPRESGKGPIWMTFTSAETGRYEVYVHDLGGSGRRWRVSTNGGTAPQWRRDGRELFYVALDGTLMSVPVRAPLELGTPRPLFPTDLRPTAMQAIANQYAVSRDGERFLLNARDPAAPGDAIAAVAGW